MQVDWLAELTPDGCRIGEVSSSVCEWFVFATVKYPSTPAGQTDSEVSVLPTYYFLNSDAIDAKRPQNLASLVQIIERKRRAFRAYGAGALHAT
jgi:hypothetical protein